MVLNRQMIALIAAGVLGGVLPATLLHAEIPDAKSVEIFVEGKKYSSLEDYREEEKRLAQAFAEAQKGLPSSKDQELAELRSMFEQAARRVDHPLDLTFDPSKVKTIYLKGFSSAPLSTDGQEHSLLKDKESVVADPFTRSYAVIYQVGVNTGVHSIVEDFVAGESRPGDVGRVNKKDLERVLQESLGVYEGPLLLMSDQKRIRVMVLEPPQSDTADNAAVRTQ